MIYRILNNIYLSSVEPINNEEDLKKEYGITHILSVLPGKVQEISYLSNYQWKQIEVTDEETTNLIPYFNESFEFIESANGGNILIHCSQGVSRSVSVIIAYLMKKHKLHLEQAIYAVKRKFPEAEPNPAFREQLKLYEKMNYEEDQLNSEYKSYLKELSLKIDPSGSNLRELIMEKETTIEEKRPDTYDLRCKKCSKVLANNNNIEEHETPGSDSRQSQFVKTAPNSRRIISVHQASDQCSHYFFEKPVPWMRDELERSELEGKFQCPKCSSKIGGYSWKGSRCSCGKWMVPAIHLQDAKVDCIKK
ncbi:YVH1 [Candida jiufengensis]|uniref:YVH1 n=1 Tax=Candida jiufengensis TaxID=497108 RepID=UPI00222500F8|nr:YVH1 [Candida jiufengensis]KAI5951101.1 YVH1 [Candida jiufengensis]